MDVEGYEYNIQFRYTVQNMWNDLDLETWHWLSTNKYDGNVWYASLDSAKRALAQTKGGWRTWEFRIVSRPYGAMEIVGESDVAA